MSFNPLISLARNAKRQRMEMQCDPQWVLDLAAERDQLRAELEAIMGKGVLYVSAESLADDGVVGMHATRKPNAVQNVALYALPPQQPDAWPTLDKPAKVGAVLFNPGLSARLVVEAAQRQHEYSQQPEVEAARLERFQSAMREFHGEPDDAVSVPREFQPHDYRQSLQCWFGLGRASWCTIPRVLMEAMPEEWQRQAAILLHEYSEAFPGGRNLPTPYVQARVDGRTTNWPEWINNYRHPDRAAIDGLRLSTKNAEEGE